MKTIYIDCSDGSTLMNMFEGSNIHQIKTMMAKENKVPVRADVYTHVDNAMVHNGRYRFSGTAAIKE